MAEPCNPIHDTSEAILMSAQRGIDTLSGSSDITSYVSHGPPVADCCNTLSVHLAPGYGPTPRHQALEFRSAMPTGIPLVAEGTWIVTLWLDCYPVVERSGERFRLPTAEELGAANEKLGLFGWAMYNAVTEDYRRGQLLIDPRQCPRFIFGQLTPLTPQGGCAGWEFSLTGQLDG